MSGRSVASDGSVSLYQSRHMPMATAARGTALLWVVLDLGLTWSSLVISTAILTFINTSLKPLIAVLAGLSCLSALASVRRFMLCHQMHPTRLTARNVECGYGGASVSARLTESLPAGYGTSGAASASTGMSSANMIPSVPVGMPFDPQTANKPLITERKDSGYHELLFDTMDSGDHRYAGVDEDELRSETLQIVVHGRTYGALDTRHHCGGTAPSSTNAEDFYGEHLSPAAVFDAMATQSTYRYPSSLAQEHIVDMIMESELDKTSCSSVLTKAASQRQSMAAFTKHVACIASDERKDITTSVTIPLDQPSLKDAPYVAHGVVNAVDSQPLRNEQVIGCALATEAIPSVSQNVTATGVDMCPSAPSQISNALLEDLHSSMNDVELETASNVLVNAAQLLEEPLPASLPDIQTTKLATPRIEGPESILKSSGTSLPDVQTSPSLSASSCPDSAVELPASPRMFCTKTEGHAMALIKLPGTDIVASRPCRLAETPESRLRVGQQDRPIRYKIPVLLAMRARATDILATVNLPKEITMRCDPATSPGLQTKALGVRPVLPVTENLVEKFVQSYCGPDGCPLITLPREIPVETDEATDIITPSVASGTMQIPNRIWKNAKTFSASANDFCVMTWNVLAPMYCTREKFPDLGEKWKAWEYRRAKILDEIVYYAADVVCLQELTEADFLYYFAPHLHKLGYRGIYRAKSRSPLATEQELNTTSTDGSSPGAPPSPTLTTPDGCALFYNTKTFRLQSVQTFSYPELAATSLLLPATHDLGTDMMRFPNTAICATLFHKSTRNRVRLVTTHLHWNPAHERTKLLQAACLMEFLAKMQATDMQDGAREGRGRKAGGSRTNGCGDSRIPIVIAGDLNSMPAERVMRFLETGQVDVTGDWGWAGKEYGPFTTPDDGQTRGDGTANAGDGSNAGVTATSTHLKAPLRFRNAYAGGELPFTNRTATFTGTIDHMLYTQESLTVRDMLGPVTGRWLDTVPALPTASVSSDHLPLCAWMCWKNSNNGGNKQHVERSQGARSNLPQLPKHREKPSADACKAGFTYAADNSGGKRKRRKPKKSGGDGSVDTSARPHGSANIAIGGTTKAGKPSIDAGGRLRVLRADANVANTNWRGDKAHARDEHGKKGKHPRKRRGGGKGSEAEGMGSRTDEQWRRPSAGLIAACV
ncbi:uncharacterized protein EV422DRAFT_155416 [Fimicolochytrium jonesii]|uniref:uncharacterized protein n=1 Tax=Fimicolochytrium jonesii TaxID=1396493 RepID=UPI0022FDD3CA|nr:uncharacterized protein EV422DRAFT_155416 [Fimicolochytrium jonesii]KAI8826148.1 hypothetical protein EV422DRAFT_155416 [Fimicolochytrium jonesii]